MTTTHNDLNKLLALIHELSRKALFERTYKRASQAALDALSKINKMTAPYA